MRAKRIIPCLDVKDGATVKGINFVELQKIGDPVEMAKRYADDGADELTLLDISATVEGRKTFVDLVARVAASIDIPLAVGGGISSVEDAEVLLAAGASKVSINSAAVARPELINEISARFGSNALIVAIDTKTEDGVWRVTTHGGNKFSDKELFSWAKEAQDRGAGEILFTSMDHDGTKKGYPCDTYARLCDSLTIPVIASGGAGSIADIVEVLTTGKADAALAASVFHYGEISIPELKKELINRGVLVKI